MRVEAYRLAQRSLADLKTAVLMILEAEGKQGLRNVDIGRALGIYSGHKGHEGHIPRTLLAMMAGEGLVHQDEKSRMWFISPVAENPVE